MAEVTLRRLSSGWWHIRGQGPCEWAQVPAWPCSASDLEAGFFPEASESFRSEVRAMAAREPGPNL